MKVSQPKITFDANGNPVFDRIQEKSLRTLFEQMVYDDNCAQIFSKYFFKESFNKIFTDARIEFSQRLSDPSIPKQWLIGYRGIGKTSLVWSETIRKICFRRTPFILYVSSDLYLAESRTEAIKRGLTKNPLIRKFFGKMDPKYVDGQRDAFGKKAWFLTDPITNDVFCVVVPKSAGTAVNGLLEYINGRQQRPQLIICDDTVDRLRVNDEIYRNTLIDWMVGTLFPCVDNDYQPDHITKKWVGVKRGNIPPWQIMVPDTCKHSDDAIANLAQDPAWIGKKYPVGEEVSPGVFKSLTEEWTDEAIKEKYDEYNRIGRTERFYKEYMCVSNVFSDERFPSTFQYYKESEMNLNTDKVVRFIIMDPARNQSNRSCPTAMVAFAISTKKGMMWIRECINAHLSQEEMTQQLFDMAERLNTDIICVEDAGLNDHIRGPLERHAYQIGKHIHWEWPPTARKYIETDNERRTGKECRVSSALWLYRPLEPHFPHGCVWHSEENIKNSALEAQMRSYPECKLWDAIDCLGHVDWVMRTLRLYFEKKREEVRVVKTQKFIGDAWDYVVKNRPYACEGAIC